MYKQILKGSSHILVLKTLGTASIVAANIFIARISGAEILGVLSLVISALSFMYILAGFGLETYAVRKIPELIQNKEVLWGFITKVCLIVMLSSISICLILVILFPVIDRLFFSSNMEWTLKILPCILLPYSLHFLISEVFKGFGRVNLSVFLSNTSYNFIFFLLVISVYVLNLQVSIVLIYYMVIIISFLISMLLTLNWFVRENPSKRICVYKNKVLKYSFPMLQSTLMLFIMGNVDIFMIGYFFNEKQVGIYAAILRITSFINFFVNSATSYIAPRISGFYVSNKIEDLKLLYRSTRLLSCLTVLSASIYIFIFPTSLLNLFGEEFLVAKQTLYICVFTQIVSALFGPIGYLMNLSDKQTVVSCSIAIGMIANVIFNLILIPKFGISGAALSALISTATYKSILYFFYKIRFTAQDQRVVAFSRSIKK